MSSQVLRCSSAHICRYTVPGMMALGGAMKKLDKLLTAEVERRLQDMQDGKKIIPVRRFEKKNQLFINAYINLERRYHMGHRGIH